jgi:dihydrofolate reductase
MRITTWTSVTLDGVMQGPGSAEEDTRGGFERGGWAHRYHDEVAMKESGVGMSDAGRLLFGRRTYEQFFSFWPKQGDDNPFTKVLNDAQKYVCSNTLDEPLPWQNSALLRGDAVEAVTALKEGGGRDAVILGSGELVRSLIPAGLIDSYTLLIHPLVLGQGQRLFPEGVLSELHLTRSVTTTTGVIIATYEPATSSNDV